MYHMASRGPVGTVTSVLTSFLSFRGCPLVATSVQLCKMVCVHPWMSDLLLILVWPFLNITKWPCYKWQLRMKKKIKTENKWSAKSRKIFLSTRSPGCPVSWIKVMCPTHASTTNYFLHQLCRSNPWRQTSSMREVETKRCQQACYKQVNRFWVNWKWCR